MTVDKKNVEIKIVEIQKDHEHLQERYEEFKQEYKATCKEVIKTVDKLKEDIVDLFHLIENIKKDLEDLHSKEELRGAQCEAHREETARLKEINKESVSKRLVEDLSTNKVLKFMYKIVVVFLIAFLSAKGFLSMDLGWLKLW